MHGILNIDKPVGMTSTDVVRRVRRALNTRKVGHAGTLDPDASGVLLVCVGEGTKAVPFLMGTAKEYTTTARWGAERLTDDSAGEVIRSAAWEHVTEEAVRAALPRFVGTIEQTPPRVSALKKDGRRMYDRVRAGEDIDSELVPRPVTCATLELLRFELPEVDLMMEVGKGFYVRSLVRDLGRALDSAAHVAALRRTRVGPFRADAACSLDDVSASKLMSVKDGLAHLPTMRVDAKAAEDLRHGRKLSARARHFEGEEPPAEVPCCALGPDDELICVAALRGDGSVQVVRGFASGANW